VLYLTDNPSNIGRLVHGVVIEPLTFANALDTNVIANPSITWINVFKC